MQSNLRQKYWREYGSQCYILWISNWLEPRDTLHPWPCWTPLLLIWIIPWPNCCTGKNKNEHLWIRNRDTVIDRYKNLYCLQKNDVPLWKKHMLFRFVFLSISYLVSNRNIYFFVAIITCGHLEGSLDLSFLYSQKFSPVSLEFLAI